MGKKPCNKPTSLWIFSGGRSLGGAKKEKGNYFLLTLKEKRPGPSRESYTSNFFFKSMGNKDEGEDGKHCYPLPIVRGGGGTREEVDCSPEGWAGLL